MQCSSGRWYLFKWSPSSGEETRPCLFEIAVSHPFMCMSTTNDYVHCTCTDTRLHMSGLCVRASRCIFVQLSSAYITAVKTRCPTLLVGCTTTLAVDGYPQYPLSVWEPVVCRWAPACWSRIPRRCSYNLNTNVKLYHIILGYGRRVMRWTLTVPYWSRWYIWMSRYFFARALIGRGTKGSWLSQPWLNWPPDIGCVWLHGSSGMCHIYEGSWRSIFSKWLHGCTMVALTLQPWLVGEHDSVHNAGNSSTTLCFHVQQPWFDSDLVFRTWNADELESFSMWSQH